MAKYVNTKNNEFYDLTDPNAPKLLGNMADYAKQLAEKNFAGYKAGFQNPASADLEKDWFLQRESGNVYQQLLKDTEFREALDPNIGKAPAQSYTGQPVKSGFDNGLPIMTTDTVKNVLNNNAPAEATFSAAGMSKSSTGVNSVQPSGVRILNEADLQAKRQELAKAGVPQSEWSKYISSPDAQGRLYWTQPATLYSPDGEGKIVATGSEEASQLFKQGYSLDKNPKTSGALTPESFNPERKIDTSGLGGSQDNAIFNNATVQGSAEVSSKQVEQKIQDIEKMLTKPASEWDTKMNDLLDSITSGLEGQESKSAIQLEEEKRRNLESLKTELSNSKANLDKKKAALTAYDANYQKEFTDIEGKPIALSRLQGQQAQLYRNYQAGRLTLQADVSLAEAEASAKLGLYNDAIEAANRATDLRYATQQDKISNQLKAFELIKDFASEKETKYMEAVKIYLEQQREALNQKQDLEKQTNAQKLDLIAKYHVGSLSDSLEALNKKVENSPTYQAEVAKAQASEHSTIYKEWQDAVSTGYNGTFIQYQNEDANRKRSISTTNIITPQQTNLLSEAVKNNPQLYFSLSAAERNKVAADLQSQGYNVSQLITPTQAGKSKDAIAAFNTSKAQLDTIEQMANKVIKADNWTSALVQKGLLTAGAALKSNPDAAIYNDTVKAFTSMLARAAGEKGVLTDTDINRIKQALPQFGDTSSIAQQKLNTLRGLFNNISEGIVSAQAQPLTNNNDPMDLGL